MSRRLLAWFDRKNQHWPTDDYYIGRRWGQRPTPEQQRAMSMRRSRTAVTRFVRWLADSPEKP